MPDETKITLSAEELLIVEDSNWVLTKQQIIKKVYELFNAQVPTIDQLFGNINDQLPADLLSTMPKISRGENYLNLPYVILDYPSVFNKENIFAFRTMFWWGNFFSITLHLSGHYKELYQQAIGNNIQKKVEGGYYICVNDKAWEHHFDAVNYVPAASFNAEELNSHLKREEFLKIAVKIDLSQWNDLQAVLPKAYKNVIDLLGH